MKIIIQSIDHFHMFVGSCTKVAFFLGDLKHVPNESLHFHNFSIVETHVQFLTLLARKLHKKGCLNPFLFKWMIVHFLLSLPFAIVLIFPTLVATTKVRQIVFDYFKSNGNDH